MDIIRKERKEGGGKEKEKLNLYPKEEVFERVTEVYEEVMEIPRVSKIPSLLNSLLIKGNLISSMILFLLLMYTIWDMLQNIYSRARSLTSSRK